MDSGIQIFHVHSIYIGLHGQDEVKQVWYRGGYFSQHDRLENKYVHHKINMYTRLLWASNDGWKRFRGAEM